MQCAVVHGDEQGFVVPCEGHGHAFCLWIYDFAALVVVAVVQHQNAAVPEETDGEFSVVSCGDRVRPLVVGGDQGHCGDHPVCPVARVHSPDVAAACTDDEALGGAGDTADRWEAQGSVVLAVGPIRRIWS